MELMCSENFDNNGDERLGTLEETINFHFQNVLAEINNNLKIPITAKHIADFCEKHEIESARLLAFHAFAIINDTLRNTSNLPNVQNIRTPLWLASKAFFIAGSVVSIEELEALISNISINYTTSEEYLTLAYLFLHNLEE